LQTVCIKQAQVVSEDIMATNTNRFHNVAQYIHCVQCTMTVFMQMVSTC